MPGNKRTCRTIDVGRGKKRFFDELQSAREVAKAAELKCRATKGIWRPIYGSAQGCESLVIVTVR